MLFNSYPFLFIFLPIALLGYQIAGLFHRKAVILWLGFISVAFYAYWRPAYVFLLASSIAVNYIAAGLISRHIPNSISSRVWLWSAILANLGVLGYFKYLFPILNFASHASGSSTHWTAVLLPLGISFFTFTQIAYLVDLDQGIATQQDFASYVLFVTFFPHLIAGPILHHKEMMPQFQEERRYRLRLNDVVVGISWFIMGFAKKVLLADTFAVSADSFYRGGEQLTTILAWRGVLSYALQLYFDFSGYSDMALGLARMFSIDFPLNFSSPYKATNIIDFWQRWHITLTRYITAYVYSPVAFWVSARRQAKGKKVSRKAQATPGGFVSLIAFPMLFTMLIAGIWHGAGFQFVIFGLLHGIYLSINHAWRLFRHRTGQETLDRGQSKFSRLLGQFCSVVLTFTCVLVAQVFFRAASSRQAFSVLLAMTGAHGVGARIFPGETSATAALDVVTTVLGFAIVWGLPNTQQILRRFKPSLQLTPWDTDTSISWSPAPSWAIAIGFVLFFCVAHLQDPSTFLYFQF